MTSKHAQVPPAGDVGLSCLLLGEEPLAIRCAEVLSERGYRIIGLVTNAPQLKRWADGHAVPVIARDRYGELLDREPVDVIFSITHPAIIKASSIAKARVAAINYHDGPLPRYAGMNGSTWALFNGEREHAIVWHHLTAGLDEGDVLARRDVELHARETSVSLNMGNSVRALEAFHEVLDRIGRGDLNGVAQSKDIERTVFSRHDRPPAMCVIDWTSTAVEIDRLVRACEFGAYTNRFGAAKLMHDGRAVIVREAVPLAGSGVPGTVLSVGSDGVLIACGSGALRLTRFTTLGGDALSAVDALDILRLHVDDVVRTPVKRSAAVDAASRRLAEAEPRNVTALERRALPSLPFVSVKPVPASRVEVEIPPAFTERFHGQLADAVTALYTFTLSCLLRDTPFDVAWVDATAREAQDLRAVRPLLFPSLPLQVTVEPAKGFQPHVEEQRRARERLEKAPAFLMDLVARHPTLRDHPDLRAGALSPVAVVVGGDAATAPTGAQLTLFMAANGTNVALHSDGVVAPASLEALAHQMATVAGKVAAAPDTPLACVDLLTDTERAAQIQGWNDTAAPAPDDLRIHELFEAQVAERPDAVALLFEGETLTFRELEGRANRVANALQARGHGPGDYVALLVERGFDLVATLLGVAKSGAAYVPVDPTYPEDRVLFMLKDAGCKCVIATRELTGSCRASLPILFVDGEEISTAATTRPPCRAASTDVCYAIYTSGSTGRPKGVVLTHRAVVNTLDWVNRTFGTGPGDRLLFVTSPSFDLSVYDVFGALGAGASIDIASARLLREPSDVARHVVENGITIWDSAPPALARLASFFPENAPDAPLRLVMLSGDWIPVWLPDHIRKIFPGAKVKSLGGATEAAIWSNYFHIGDVDPGWSSIPYGYPIQNARYYILDPHMRPVPPLTPGDLYIAGRCLAEGYLNREELTAERFIADPFHPGERMYKTGDLARYWSDGTMEFLGRADFQVKIRGFRVEMGEVEAEIRALDGVRDAVCSTWVDGAAQKALVAYVVPRPGIHLDVRVIKENLGARLPEFMVPSYVIAIDSLPLSPNGKLDRKALPSPLEAQSAAAYQAARTPIEKKLVSLWEEVLSRKPIGVHDDFFDIGGHSLLAVVLITVLKRRLNVDVPLSTIIEAPTIARLAAALATPVGDSGRPGLSVELRSGGPGALFFVHDGDGETLLYRTLAQQMPSDFAVYAIAPRRLPGIPLADPTVEAMATSYVEEVRRRQPRGPYHIAGLCAGGVIAFEMAVQLERAGEKVEMLVILDAVEPRTHARSGVVAGRRWSRMRELLLRAGAPRKLSMRGAARVAGEAARKVKNTVEFEITRRLRETSAAARYRLLEGLVARGRAWPELVPSLTVREIYMAAKSRYAPRVLRSAHVLVVKASEGADADEPAIYQIDDPLLGWGKVVKGELEAVDVPGGHSSMLQAPNVHFLAAAIIRVLHPLPDASAVGTPAGDQLPHPIHDKVERNAEHDRQDGGPAEARGKRARERAEELV